MDKKIQFIVQIGLLIAIEAIFAFTPLGFIMIPPMALTLLHIPVIIAAVLYGYKGGMILGGFFGICSMIKATIGPLSPIDMAFSPILASTVGGNILTSVVLAFVTRILFGVLAGFIFQLIDHNIRSKPLSISLTALFSTILHTVMVMACLSVFFKDINIDFADILLTVASFNCFCEVISAVLLSSAICLPLLKIKRR